MTSVVWKDEPEDHDYPAAEPYLTLITDPMHAHALVTALQRQLVVHHKAKDITTGTPLQIADGYHRVCASYHVDENTDIPCRIVDA